MISVLVILSTALRDGSYAVRVTGQNDTPIWSARFSKMVNESFAFLTAEAQRSRERVAVRAVPARDGDHRVVYRCGVRGELVPLDVVEDLRDILARGRSVLDIAMFGAATAQAAPPLSEKDKKNTYFPIATTEQAWQSMEGQPHMQALTQNQRDSLRRLQPFETGDFAISEFARIHNEDKHQSPQQLVVIPDPQFVMMFENILPLPMLAEEYWLEWVEPLPAVANRVVVFEYRSLDPIQDAGIEEMPVALAVEVGGMRRDVEHFLWDVISFISRATAILHDGDTKLADSFRDYFTSRRTELEYFRKMLVDGDAEAERAWLAMRGQEQTGKSVEDVKLHLLAALPGSPLHRRRELPPIEVAQSGSL
jgi:hypothetical protein